MVFCRASFEMNRGCNICGKQNILKAFQVVDGSQTKKNHRPNVYVVNLNLRIIMNRIMHTNNNERHHLINQL